MKIKNAIVYAWFLAAIVTYGHAFNNADFGGKDKAVGSVLVCAVWPIYWSVQAWSDK